jgi:hypothetical protein
VELAIKQVLTFEHGDEQDLDLADFDAVEYINRQFPTEASLDGLDMYLSRTVREVGILEENISRVRGCVRRLVVRPCVRAPTPALRRRAAVQSVLEQSTAGLQAGAELNKARTSITELFGKIREIKTKAAQSEQMVQDICKDIRQLDVAKRHLTNSIVMLKRLQMLVIAVDQLQVRPHRRRVLGCVVTS